METLKTVGVKNLKNNLSAYLREVKAGVRVLITEHDIVVAEISRPFSSSLMDLENPLLAQWIREGKVLPATAPKKPCPKPPFSFPEGIAQKELDASREENDPLLR